ncbi:MAG: TlpA family protein disulfide reductase [Armatimonadetes bacterium]|nr:TlpA family protein disulfide reductase [Armatimonadota bacterium]
MQEIYTKGKQQGLAILAIDRGDTADAVSEYWTDSKFSFPAVLAPDDVHSKFGVRAYPTNYIVDSKGKVVARFVGYDEAKLLEALKSQGITISK